MSLNPLHISRNRLVLIAIAGLLALPASGIHVRSYDANDHDRFAPYQPPSQNIINPNSIHSDVDLGGVGIRINSYPTMQCALISRQHVIFATHFKDQVANKTLQFLNASNQATNRFTGTETVIEKAGNTSDLVVFELSAPIDADTGINPLPYYDALVYTGTDIGVLGIDRTDPDLIDQFPVMGSGTVSLVQEALFDLYDNGSIVTKVYQFEYDNTPGGGPGKSADDCYLQNGDSGSPSFVKVNGRAALLGVHSSVLQVPGAIVNLDTLVPHYITELDAVLNPMGYRMAPVNAPATTLVTTTSTLQPTPRRAMPLDYVYQIENTGGELTGNVEVEFLFDPAEAPDSITGPSGWVVYGSGSKWTMRKATLAAAGLTSVTAQWSQAPSVSTLSFTVTRRSDTTTDDIMNVDLPLAGSYAEWAMGLGDDGLMADPDGDGLINLHEYAFGADPFVGSRVFADGSPLPAGVVRMAGNVSVSFPERSDALERGLSYDLEFSSDLGSWSATPPSGFSSFTDAYDPPVEGFVRRVCSWPLTPDPRRFLRVQVDLNE